ncbi:MAG TPA: ABC transporter permease [Terriglobia bacterium]|nr:ABC transporter permease [Terriglobia bacterium]
MTTLFRDLRYALRTLANSPGFTAVALLTLALGIGATTAIFTVVNTVLLRPLPYRQPQSLARIYTEFPTFPHGGLPRFWTSAPEYFDLKRDMRSWETLDAWIDAGSNLAGSATPVRITNSYVTGGLLPSLGVSPARGRLIAPADDLPGAPLTADISYGLWQSAFAGDPGVVGRDTLFNGARCTIIGVMPPDFHFPPGEVDPPQVWVPLQLDPAKPGGRGSHNFYLLGRLKPGVTIQQARAEFLGYERASAEHASANNHHFDPKNHTLVTYPLQEEVVGGVRPALLMLLGVVGFVLLIACANVASLLLARAEAREREVAIRSALGASTRRLLRQFITEGILLAGLGAAAGLLLAYGGLAVIKGTNDGSIPRLAELSLDLRVLLFALGVSVGTGLFFGIAPLVHLAAGNLHDRLKSSSSGRVAGSTTSERFRRGMVVAQIALALTLLIGTGLMMRAFWKLQQVDVGVNPRGLISMQVNLPGAIYKTNSAINDFWVRLQQQLEVLPGVESATLAYGLPPQRPPNENDTEIEGFVMKQGGPIQNVDFYQAAGDHYFETVGIRLMEGRFFSSSDRPGAPDVAIVNQTMARTFWGNQSPIGRRVRPGFSDPWCTVVGVVEDVKNAGIEKPAGTELYLPLLQKQAEGTASVYIILRSSIDPRSLVGPARRVVNGLDPQLPVSKIRTLDDVILAAQARPRFLTVLLTIFAGVALILAAVGLYGVIAYGVTQRTQEFGVRMALGARPGDVLMMVLGQGGRLAALGVVLGWIAALALTRTMSSLLFGVRATDPVTYLAVSGVLALVALFASYIPARRATRLDPMAALRQE